MKPDFRAVGRYFTVYVNDVQLSQHSTEREACQAAGGAKLENPSADVLYRHEYEVIVSLKALELDQVETFDVTVEVGL